MRHFLAKCTAVSFTMKNERLLQLECMGGVVKTTPLTADKHSGTTGWPCDAFRDWYFTSESSSFHVTAGLGNWRPLKVHVIIRVWLERMVEERRVERRRLKMREGEKCVTYGRYICFPLFHCFYSFNARRPPPSPPFCTFPEVVFIYLVPHVHFQSLWDDKPALSW